MRDVPETMGKGGNIEYWNIENGNYENNIENGDIEKL
jgi:hypothetical protein